ncbi:MAG: alpha-rhamnosidase [Prevotella sp.]|nr:alpha-rhamnosidase [Prevotella sp.]
MKKRATWIWYPGDFEVWLGNRFNNRRTERGAMFPPFWKQDSHWATVEFSKTVHLEREETIEIAVEGEYNFMLDGKLQFGMPTSFTIPSGEHRLNIKVYNLTSPPSIYIKGETIHSNDTWLATYEDKIWIDENGTAHGSGIYIPAACWDFDDITSPPSQYQLPRKETQPVLSIKKGNGILYDFGRETFGYLKFKNTRGEGTINIYYGESKEEALDKEHCETLDRLACGSNRGSVCCGNATTTKTSKAFRYVYIETDVEYESLAIDYEYTPFDASRSGSFRCNDQELNDIWDVAAYTMDLTTREFFVDGIKRDRWVWSGDAIQSYLMNYYLRFDTECVKRTIRQLRGKDPVTAHINTIMDYTFYWFKSIHDFYLYTGDIAFVREIYPRMKTMMDYCLSRTNTDGMAEGKPDDWIFVDWVDFPMHKRGVLCFEQVLFCKALETIGLCASILRDHPLPSPPQGSITTMTYNQDANLYFRLAKHLLSQMKTMFWDEENHAFIHAIEDGKRNDMITKFPNMFAIIYGYVSDKERQDIMEHVMLNDDIEKITTPYMRFYELETLCMMGHHSKVLDEMKDYWGGMLREGATTFWEKYIPSENGKQHLAMYGRPYGKSLCHAWGASPIYILGKYFFGVQPTKPGYEEYIVKPSLGRLEWMEGDVPTPFGKIHVTINQHEVHVLSDGGRGTLIIHGKEIPIYPHQETFISILT